MRKVDLLEYFERVVAPQRERTGRPFPDTVQCQHRGRGIGRWKKRACGVTQMMLAENKALVPVEVGTVRCYFVRQIVFQKQLSAQPDWDRHPERFESPGRKSEISLQQPFEFEERFVVERNQVNLVEADLALRQAVIESVAGKTRIVLLARKPLLL